MICVGIIEKLKQMLGLQPKTQAIESASEALQSDLNRSKALASEELSPSIPIESTDSIELQKDSLQLGVAAGYTAHTIRDIESSLDRIESQMLTRDWFISKFDDKMSLLVESLRMHEENERKRFEIIQNFLSSLQKIALKAPEPLRSEIFQQIEAVERQLPLTFKMKEILQIIKEAGEISYEDLSKRLGISVSAIRGILSNMIKRTNEIERFEKDRKGWVRYIGESDLKRIESLEDNLLSSKLY
jgi:uncharacterized membrane protein